MIVNFIRRYHRHEVQVDAMLPAEPSLLVSNHGFGGAADLNIFALVSALDELHIDREVTYLSHEIAWTLGLGPFVEALGCRQASQAAAEEAFTAARHVAVFPGGDIEAAKPWRDRNRIVFAGRIGYARSAIDHDVPVVPIVTVGAGESLLVLSDGQRFAKALGLPRLLRAKALPISISIPWGLNVGLVGMLPYLPLPTKITTAVLPAMRPEPGEAPEHFAVRIETAMQARMDTLVEQRIPILG
ncbi:glycerol acyltransferase [Nocardia sp. ET3-3]|uniref:Glycerol acyltransferase n=1 Tax=Nocardia terrae TaxID=2675851 RepID=A0A7K1V216_9NOCA|nr:1-acyl-sn-glycerol-3-phosphate acyltransferase [Nocardia terrae]MVU80680.1 glycerol acyltransferase [Nocardia terrae]